jgi:hypothetical protein
VPEIIRAKLSNLHSLSQAVAQAIAARLEQRQRRSHSLFWSSCSSFQATLLSICRTTTRQLRAQAINQDESLHQQPWLWEHKQVGPNNACLSHNPLSWQGCVMAKKFKIKVNTQFLSVSDVHAKPLDDGELNSLRTDTSCSGLTCANPLTLSGFAFCVPLPTNIGLAPSFRETLWQLEALLSPIVLVPKTEKGQLESQAFACLYSPSSRFCATTCHKTLCPNWECHFICVGGFVRRSSS